MEGEKEYLLKMFGFVVDLVLIGIVFVLDGKFELVSNGFCEVFGLDKLVLFGLLIDWIFVSDLFFECLDLGVVVVSG